MDELTRIRASRWWQRRRPLRSIERAAAFVDDVGFALLFPSKGIELPSLYGATSDRSLENLGTDWGPDAERVWGWKDELPRRGLAWYGRFLRGRPSLLSPALLEDLYPRSGRPDDFQEAPLGDDARRIGEVLLLSGPTATPVLREVVGTESGQGRSRFERALSELGRALVVTNYGTEQVGGGWPAAVLELTSRAFRLDPRRDRAAARLSAAGRFLDTMVMAGPRDLALAYGWTGREARETLGRLAARGEVSRDGTRYRPSGR